MSVGVLEEDLGRRLWAVDFTFNSNVASIHDLSETVMIVDVVVGADLDGVQHVQVSCYFNFFRCNISEFLISDGDVNSVVYIAPLGNLSQFLAVI